MDAPGVVDAQPTGSQKQEKWPFALNEPAFVSPKSSSFWSYGKSNFKKLLVFNEFSNLFCTLSMDVMEVHVRASASPWE